MIGEPIRPAATTHARLRPEELVSTKLAQPYYSRLPALNLALD